MNEDESLRRYGLSPAAGDLNEVRDILAVQTARERRHQGDGDTELMKLCCVQLFNAGFLTDALLIWDAKESSWDAHCSIDVQLLCAACASARHPATSPASQSRNSRGGTSGTTPADPATPRRLTCPGQLILPSGEITEVGDDLADAGIAERFGLEVVRHADAPSLMPGCLPRWPNGRRAVHAVDRVGSKVVIALPPRPGSAVVEY